MTPSQITEDTKTKLASAVSHFQEELKKLRTGRAHPSMLDGVMVQAYGVDMPLIQVGTITTPEPQLLQITPFDPGNLQAVATAIRDNQALGLNPMDDGRVVRIRVPPLTEERRKDFVKVLGTKAEDCMIAMRNIRHEALKEAEQAKKDKTMGDDDYKRLEKQVDDLLTASKTQVESLAGAKEKEILTV